LGALFAFDLRALVTSVLEMTLMAARFQDPRAQAVSGMNSWGDHTGHTEAKALGNQAALRRLVVTHQTGAAIESGDGTS